MISTDQVQTLRDSGGTVVDESGEKVGKIGQIYLDDETGNPEWVTTKTGLFGGSETFVPLQRADGDDTEIRVPYSKDMIKDAPRMEDAEGHLSREQEDELYRYYGLDAAAAAGQGTGAPPAGGLAPVGGQAGGDRGQDVDATSGRDTSGPTTTDDAMTRSEEQFNVGTESRESGKARLRADQAERYAASVRTTLVSVDALGAAARALPDPVSPSLTRAVMATERAWREMDAEFGLLSSSEVARLSGSRSANRTYASERRTAGKLLGVRRGREFRYPGFQFDEGGQVLSTVAALLELAAESHWSPESLALWLCGPSGRFEGNRPVDALTSDPEAVLDAAEQRLFAQW
ncbi:MAG: PRC-barrel domain-containing protein [Actinomycetota bacterium]|jgi:sporulation protein YlmC with PRC-barrel domain|nr:PRC-barrel domain-containing protein [Actinomycetota bacterium]